MNSILQRALSCCALVTFGALAPLDAAHAQDPTNARSAGLNWPTKAIRIVVGFGGGSSPDFVARTLAGPMSRLLGQPVIVENRPGASGNIAADVVARSTDQHTIGMLINGNMTIAKILNPATPYDPHKDLIPLSLICTAPLVLATAVRPADWTHGSFIETAKAAGTRWSFGSPGVGTLGHLGMELLKAHSGIAAVHVPYMGNPQVVNDLMSGELQLALLPPGLAEPQVSAGKLRAIGVTSAVRSPLVPSYPSLQEVGLKNFELEIWTAAAGPATLPAPIAARLSAVVSEVARSPDVQLKLFAHGYQAVGSSATALAQRLGSDTASLTQIIQSQGIKLD